MKNQLQDIQLLIQRTFILVKKLLPEQGEFYPFAFVVNKNNDISPVDAYDGDEFPASENVIKILKKRIKRDVIKDILKAVVIYYGVIVLNPSTNKKTDAIAIFAEHANDTSAYIFYYPYQIDENKVLNISESFGDVIAKEIFLN